MQGGFEVFRTKKGAIGAFRCLSSLFVPRRNHKQYTYGFDHNGNPTTTHEQYAPPLQGQPNPSGPIDLIQENYWDEQNQLRGLWNLSGLHHYIYDADGQRLMKSSVPMSYSSVNAQQLQATNSIAAQDYTVYVSAGLVYESNRGSTTYTKHYYAGPLRVASQICSANPNQVTHPKTGNLTQRGPAGSTAQTNGQAVLSDLNTLLANYGMAVDANEPPHDTLSMQVINDPDECRMFYGDDLIEENRCLCDNFPDIAIQQGIDCNPYTPIYWYHPDYIGNVEFVSDRTGQPYQHFYYAAFGDPMVSQHAGTGSFNSAFRFNAKEYDEETGNYYYGARYYEPKSSVWMGVDALATKYPSMNPYNFVMGNPIMAIDPDGNSVDGWIEDSQTRELHWDENVNNQSEFNKSGYDAQRYKYAGQETQRFYSNGSTTGSLYTQYYGPNGNSQIYGYPNWITSAAKDLGMHEVYNEERVAAFTNHPGLAYYDDNGNLLPGTMPNGIGDNRPWCACFVNYHLEINGFPGAERYPAGVRNWEGTWKSWKGGYRIDKPTYGAIVTLGNSHIGMIIGMQGDEILILGGNQDQMVSVIKRAVGSSYKFFLPKGYSASPLDSDRSYLQNTNFLPINSAASLK